MSVSGENDPFLDVILETADVPLLTLDADLRVKLANDAFLEQFAVSRDQTLGRRSSLSTCLFDFLACWYDFELFAT